eukprot:9025212-Pyramimonas_sp.AAC.1
MALGEWDPPSQHEDGPFQVLMVNGSKDDVEAYGSSSRDPPGTAVLDAACQMTMHGTPWRI